VKVRDQGKTHHRLRVLAKCPENLRSALESPEKRRVLDVVLLYTGGKKGAL